MNCKNGGKENQNKQLHNTRQPQTAQHESIPNIFLRSPAHPLWPLVEPSRFLYALHKPVQIAMTAPMSGSITKLNIPAIKLMIASVLVG